ncbi:MAG TPA: MOSC domain-containing protein [Blastocatellia bacterium]|nr:MOSC domain-containing protein [Blastocatellia bacterium]
MRSIQLLSIQVGLPQALTSRELIGSEQTTWTTAFLKKPVTGPVWIGKTNVAGDGQGSPKTHGGPEKAVCAYPWEHYSYWQRELDLPDLVYGAIGENFTLQGQLEDESCIGDSIRFGEAVVQVSQPRPPCWRLARWWQRKDFAALMEKNGRSGWYCRVIQEGYAEAGAPIELLERPNPEWTVSLANLLQYGMGASREQMRALASCRLLSESWRESLLKREAKLTESD